MAPSPGDMYKTYFNDPTLSDLTIVLSDLEVYVHRIILCHRSKYFNRLILNGFKESSLKEISMHGDDPVVMMAMFRHIYDLHYEHLNEDPKTKWQFLAHVYIVAGKYQVKGLHQDVTGRMKDWLWETQDIESSRSAEDFVAVVRIIFDGTTNEDRIGRPSMVDFCVCCIHQLKKLPEFKMLMNEYDDLGTEILAHERLSLMLEGTWLCCRGEPHSGAIPRCPHCTEPYPLSYARVHREQSHWLCSSCQIEGHPVCTETHGASICDWASH